MLGQYSALIPDPCNTYEQARRHAHCDLRELSPRDIWAELQLVERELARLVWQDRGRDRPRDAVSTKWLAERRRYLREELPRRRRRR